MAPHHNHNSDSDDDPDYVPPADEAEGSEDGNENTDKGQKPPVDEEDQKKERSALWASFQASVSTPTPPPKEQESPVELVKIEKRYLFAGKHVTEVVEVPAESEDAKKWPLWRPHESDSAGERAEEGRPPSATPDSASGPTSRARPGPRKPRTMLPALPTPGSSKAKKITTLDKSAMDWRAHVTSQSSDVQDELTANKRGGGYLDKVDFLQRVQDRRLDVLEGSKSNKRRKI